MFWQKFRGLFMLGLACGASPCCTPFLVPVGMSLLVGTPAAAWLAYHLGLVYGGLSLVSIVSFIFAIRWIQAPKSRPRGGSSWPNAKNSNLLNADDPNH